MLKLILLVSVAIGLGSAAVNAQPAPAAAAAAPAAPAPVPAAAPAAQPPAPQPYVTWQVADRFRLFDETKPLVVQKVDGILARLASNQIANQYDFLEHQLRADANGVGPSLFENTHFDRASGSYAIDYVQPRAQHIVASLALAGPAEATCAWQVNGAEVTQPCAAPFEFDLPFDQTTFVASGVVSVRTGAATPVAPVRIVTQDRLVLVLGDSYAAGEGNPDRPADLTQVKADWGLGYTRPTDWWRITAFGVADGNVLPIGASAQWWSNECHRSLFSPQVLAAMKLAAADPHRSVTFVSFACSGAATLDGFVTLQQNPPGEARAPGPAHRFSQLEQAVQTLCASQPGRQPLRFRPADYQVWQGIYAKTYGADAAPSYPTCPNGDWRRKPDVIFITLGGNDVGFAGLGAWALLPTNVVNADAINALSRALFNGGLVFVCPAVPFRDESNGTPVSDSRCAFGDYTGNLGAKHLIEAELPGLFQLAADGLALSGLGDRAVVVQEAYPAPFNDAQGQLCGALAAGSDFAHPQDLEQVWRALDVLVVLPSLAPSVDRMKTHALAERVLPKLDEQIATSAAEHHWVVAAPPPEYAKHGFCAGSGDLYADFGFPQIKPAYFLGVPIGYRGGWDPKYFRPTGAPSDWDPYKVRERWLRVANDSLLTQMVGDSGGTVSFESLVGMLHPTAQGEAAVADQLTATLPKQLWAPMPANAAEAAAAAP